jgi:integrase
VGSLLAHQLGQSAQKARCGVAYRDHDLVFAQPNGDPIHPKRLTKRFAQLVTTSGLRQVRLHDLRHGGASMLLAAGTDISLVSKMLGHSSITLTADTYSHMLDGVGQRAADAADALIPRQRRDQFGLGDADSPSR